MKPIFKKTICFLTIIVSSYISQAQPALKDFDFKKSKSFTQTYDLASSDKVSVNNQFGNIKVITWTDAKVKVDVAIEVTANTEARATKIIDGISIAHSKANNSISFKTNIASNSNYSSSKKSSKSSSTSATNNIETVSEITSEDCNCGSNSYNQSMKIDYTVYLPSVTTLSLHNAYGNSILDDYKGALRITNEYGNLTAGALTNEGSEINVEYGNADIKSLTNPDINVEYGNADIASISGKGEMKFSYAGDVSIGMAADVGDVKISNDYSNMEIMLSENANASFIINSSYGDVKSKSKFLTLTSDKDENSSCCDFTKRHEGKIGNGKAKIKINNEYGKVKIR